MEQTTNTTARTRAPRRGRSARAGAVLLVSSALLLAACSDDTSATEPTEAETGVPLLEGTADPAAEPTTDIAPSD